MLKGSCGLPCITLPLPSICLQSERLPPITHGGGAGKKAHFYSTKYNLLKKKKDNLWNILRGTFYFVHNQIDGEHFTSEATKTQQPSNVPNAQARCELLSGSTDSKLRVLLTTLYIACIKTKMAW